MNRRRALALIGSTATSAATAAAGCLSGNGGSNGTPTDTPTSTNTPTPNPDDDRPSERLSFRADVTGGFADEAPATLELTAVNRSGTEVTATGTYGPVVPFGGRFGYDPNGESQLLLHPDGADDLWFRVDESDLVPAAEVLPSVAEDGCWRIPEEYDGIAVPPGRISREIPPEGSLTQEYTLYHLHRCVPGTYTFSQSMTLAAEGLDPEEGVPLGLRTTIQENGDVAVDSFGIQDGYPS